MKNHTLLREIVHSDLDAWTREALTPLTGVELTSLCSLIGIPYTGSKERKLERIVYCAALQYRLRRYDRTGEDAPDPTTVMQLSEALSGKEFAEIFKTIGIYKPSTKYGCAAALIKWKRNCNRRGKDYLNMILKSKITNKKQLWLF